ncbi:glucan 1,3-beta-glucosidase [Plectosphaerella plurivora]|uniref:Probable glucan endo-1,3-beta-glucosidase eglC n=1 Tax=Plectosphaerella plurivora TaxID=936078 RepID=A0A9P8V1X2_9PEZI|nr:glucan 1,3-beta-glucosidase [Plectosphaerella plurivora]
MLSKHSLVALMAAVSSVSAAYQGFNYGNTFTNGAAKSQQDFEAEFRAAANLAGTNGDFTSARLYTMIQAGTTDDPISAIQAAINTRTSLLLGIWASAGSAQFENELNALRRAIDQYGDELSGLVAGISVGSEDLYRNSPTGIAANSNPGANPQTIVEYIGRVREAIQGTPFSSFPIGHVDTWTAFDNSSNSAVIDAADWLGFNGFAYFEDTVDNDISNGQALFDTAMDRVRAAAGGKPIWVTETGWPVSGDTFGQGVANTENAERFWQEVGCPLFEGDTNVWWYILRYAPTSPNPDFGIIGSDINSGPRFDLSCAAVSTTSSSSAAATATTTATVASGTTTVVVPPPASTETEGDDDEPASSTSAPTTTAPADDDDAVTTTTVVVAPTSTSGSDDDDQDDTPIVPGPPPTTLSSAVSSAAPTGNESTSTPPQPTTSTVEPGSASAMSFSAAFLAVMLAVALF